MSLNNLSSSTCSEMNQCSTPAWHGLRFGAFTECQFLGISPKLVEVAETRSVFLTPQHPHSEALMSAVPRPDPRFRSQRIVLEGDVPDPSDPPAGCHFHPRCRYVEDICRVEEPPLEDTRPLATSRETYN